MLRPLLITSALSISVAAFSGFGAQEVQEPTATAESKPHPKADPKDVESIEAIVTSLYDVISGDIGEARDWDRFRSLFHPELGQLVPLRPNVRAGTWSAQAMDPEGYAVQARNWTQTTAFWEKEISNKVEHFGGLAHVWSTYEGFNKKDAKEPFVRGINSIQLMNDGKRWWVLTVAWDAERDDQPLPPKYLPAK